MHLGISFSNLHSQFGYFVRISAEMRPRALLRCAPASTKDETEADELRHETQQLNHAIDSLNGVGFRGGKDQNCEISNGRHQDAPTNAGPGCIV